MADVKELISVEREGNGIATVTLNRPKAMNSLSQAMIDYLSETFKSLSEDTTIKVIILTGAGKAFCAGVVIFLPYLHVYVFVRFSCSEWFLDHLELEFEFAGFKAQLLFLNYMWKLKGELSAVLLHSSFLKIGEDFTLPGYPSEWGRIISKRIITLFEVDLV
jgi:hypothetical protein